MAGVAPATIRSWVLRGWLEPVRRGVRPLRFHDHDVAACAAQRRSRAERDRLDDLATRWEAAVLDSPAHEVQR